MASIPGLVLITPSSVSGSGVSLSGAKIVLSASTAASVNDCFTSSYDNYLIIARGQCATASDNIVMRLRASGSDASGSDYTRQLIDVNDTSLSSLRQSSQTSAHFAFFNPNPSGSHFFVYGPALAQSTAFRSISAASTNGAYISDYASIHSLATAYDGFSISSTRAVTGSILIYGLNQ